jgi:DNA-binding response OmpR family regulator
VPKCSIRVFIIDDDPKTCRDLEELCELNNWQSFVASRPRDKDIVLAEARAFRPHVAIVDMRLVEGDTNNREGFAQ